ncbi:MAG: hypothetical protein ACR2QJ_10125 [Geminicoccaceae bacterium]
MKAADTIIANAFPDSGQASEHRRVKFHARQLPTRANAVQQEIEIVDVSGSD